MKKYVLKYENYFISNDEVEGCLLVSDVEEACIFSEKDVEIGKDYVRCHLRVCDVVFRIGDTLWKDDLKNEIILTSVPVVVEV